jgi:hypothetical protein
MRCKWEYLILHLGDPKFLTFSVTLEDRTQRLNSLGEEGWELVSSFEQPEIKSVTLTLKRQR